MIFISTFKDAANSAGYRPSELKLSVYRP